VTLDRHALAATSTGFSALDKVGTSVDHALAGGPFVALTFSDQGSVLFIASASAITRVSLDSALAPTSSAATIYDNAGAATIRALALRPNGDLLFTEDARLRRITNASSAASAPNDLATFAGGEEPRGIAVNSAGNVIVAVAAGA